MAATQRGSYSRSLASARAAGRRRRPGVGRGGCTAPDRRRVPDQRWCGGAGDRRVCVPLTRAGHERRHRRRRADGGRSRCGVFRDGVRQRIRDRPEGFDDHQDGLLRVRELLSRGRQDRRRRGLDEGTLSDRANPVDGEGLRAARPCRRDDRRPDEAGPTQLLPAIRSTRNRPVHPAVRGRSPRGGDGARHRWGERDRRRLLDRRRRPLRRGRRRNA